MNEYDNELTGVIGKNDRKEKDSQPDIKGNCEIGGTQYWISGWKRDRKDGSGSFYKLQFEPKEAQKPAQKKPAASRVPGSDDDLEEIPF